MKLHISPHSEPKTRQYVIAAIRRNKGRIAFTTGRLYFYHKSSVDIFLKEVAKDDTLEVVEVNVYKASGPDEEDIQKGYWCPYCRKWEYWASSKKDGDGYKHCPICGISDGDYYVKTHNQLWHRSNGKTLKEQKQQHKANQKPRRKRKK